MTTLRELFRGAFQTKQDHLLSVPALLGDGQGNINVAGSNNRSYVRIGGQVTEVRNTRIRQMIDNLPIIVGTSPEEPGVTQILSVNTGPLAALNYALGTITAHAKTHRLWVSGGGTDPIYLEGYQLLPGRLGPVSTSVSVTVYPFVTWIGGAWREAGNETLDLSAHVPATAGKCRMVLISVDADGDLVQTAGSEVNLADLAPLTDTPNPPAGTAVVLGAVRCYYGQTAVQQGRTNKDIMDCRFIIPYHTHSDLSEVVNADANLYQYVLIRDEKPQNTNGGTATAGSPETRVLNTEVFDAGNNVALANNQMTVEAGNYRVFIKATALGVRIHRARLQNITDGTTLLEGQNAYGVFVSGYPSQCDSVIVGRIALAAQKVLEVQSQVSNTVNNTGYGQATTFSGNEIYTVVELWKEP